MGLWQAVRVLAKKLLSQLYELKNVDDIVNDLFLNTYPSRVLYAKYVTPGFCCIGMFVCRKKEKKPTWTLRSYFTMICCAVLFILDLYSKRCRNQQAGLGKMLLRSQSWHDVYPSILRSSSGLLFFLFLYTLLGGGSSRVLLVVNDLDLQSARCEGEMCGEGRWTFD